MNRADRCGYSTPYVEMFVCRCDVMCANTFFHIDCLLSCLSGDFTYPLCPTSRNARVPPDFGALDLHVRSFHIQYAEAGFCASSAASGLTVDQYHVHAGLLTSHFGALEVSLDSQHLSFAQQLQLCHSRINDSVSVTGPSHLATQFLPDLPSPSQPDSDSGHNSNSTQHKHTSNGSAQQHQLSAKETLLLPLCPGETVVHRFEGGFVHAPCLPLSLSACVPGVCCEHDAPCCGT